MASAHRCTARRRTARRGVLVAPLLVAVLLAGCGGDDGDGATTSTTEAADTSTTAADSSTSEATSTTAGDGATTTTTAAVAPPLDDASLDPRSAPARGTAIALLQAVRVGRQDGFERIVFEFAGDSVPGYRIGWVDPPITADGSGEEVELVGDAYLQMVMDPASGVDLSAPELEITYEGPDRIPVAGQTELIESLVRTGDFEAVLTWVAGTSEEVPFRVLTLTSPTRVVVDLATS